MSKAADRLRAAGFINPSDIATFAAKNGLPDVYIAYRPSSASRLSAWQILQPFKQTDPEGGWWGDFGNKTFKVYGTADRAAKLAEAQTWAAERYGITNWSPIPGMGTTRFPTAVAALVKERLSAR